MEPIRILHVMSGMNRGGAETYVMNLYRNIDRKKIQFDFVLHTDKECAFNEEIRKLGGRIYSVPRYNGKNHISYKRTWEEFFYEHKEHIIVHAHVRSTASIFLKIAKKHNRITISHSHSTSNGKGIESIFKKILQYPIRHNVDHMFACSQEAGKWLFGIKSTFKSNFKILYNAIEIKEYLWNTANRKMIREKLDIKENTFVIGHVGRFHPLKNHDFLIDIFEKVHEEYDDSILILIGDGETKKLIKEKVYRLKLNNSVMFLGVRDDVPDLMHAMDIFVFPSLWEGLGIVNIEAQAAGLKCIVSNTIPKEAYITDLIKPMELKSGKEIWASEILKHSRGYLRKNMYKEIKGSGYDIKESIEILEHFYLEQYEYHLK